MPTHHLMLAQLALAAFLALAVSEAAEAKRPQGAPKHVPAPDTIFTNGQVLRIQIEIPEQGMNALRRTPRRGFGAAGQARPTVKAVVREGGQVYNDVAVHLKGAAGSFRDVDSQPGLTLNFDKFVKGQTFHGLERISLNNSVQDRSYLNEIVAREMFAAAGVPVPRASHAKVELNGRDLGVYVLAEAFNKQFLVRHFKDDSGNLYDGGFLRDVTDDLEKASGRDPEDRSDLRRLAEAAREANLTNRWARLQQVLDVDRFITYVALGVLMCDWDGYALNRNNYRIYNDPVSRKIVFMPHGLDQMFGVMRASTDMPLFPRMSGLVARGLLQTAEGRRQYREQIVRLMDSVYKVDALTNRAWQLATQLRPALAERGPEAVRSHEREVRALCARITARAENIRDQLSAPETTLQFDAAGTAPLADWRPRGDYGKPVLEETAQGQQKLLHISAENGSCVGVWSTRVRLEPGQYRFVGKVRCQGVVPDAGDRRGGVGLRTAGRRFAQKLTGTSDWTEVIFDFDIGDSPGEFNFMAPIQSESPDMELICELRARAGEAWFDQGSLRLMRR